MSQETVTVDGIEVTVAVRDGEAQITDQQPTLVREAEEAVMEHLHGMNSEVSIEESRLLDGRSSVPKRALIEFDGTNSNMFAAGGLRKLHEEGWLVNSVAVDDERDTASIWMSRLEDEE